MRKNRRDPYSTPPGIRNAITIALTLAMACALAGCAAVPEPACAPGERPAISELLYFGTAKPGGVVSDSEWNAFLQASVSPRFEQGFSAWPASGQWRGTDGAVVREASHVISLVHDGDERSDAAVRAIVGEYKSRFQQEAVLRVRSRVCASF